MNWPVMRPALAAAVRAATGLPANNVVWKGTKEEAGWSPGGIVAKLSVSNIRSVGNDEERRVKYDAQTNTRTLTLSGARQFSFTVRIELQDESDTALRDVYADRMRVRVWRESVAKPLRAAGISVADIRPTVSVDGIRAQNRVLSVAVIEFLMNAAENDVDTTPGSAEWIAEVKSTGTLERPDGTTITVLEDTKRATP